VDIMIVLATNLYLSLRLKHNCTTCSKKCTT